MAARKGGGGSGIAGAQPEIQQRFQQAVALFQAGDGAAEEILSAIERDAPGLPEVSHLLGMVLLRAGRARDAVAPLAVAAKALPQDAGLCSLLGVAYETAGDPEAAVAAFRQGISRDRKHADSHYNLANALRRMARDADAVAPYREALRLEPGFADAHHNLGMTLAKLGHLSEAITRFRSAIALGPDRADGHIGLSGALAMTRDYGAAERAARAALERAPDSVEAYKALAAALQGQGRIAAAAETLRQAIEQAPEPRDLHTLYGNMLEELGETAAAEAAYRGAVALDPGYVVGHVNLAALLLLTGRYDEGWLEYDWHWRREGQTRRPFPQRRWTGEAMAGRTILAWADEGVGDEILFASQFAALSARAAKVVVECDARLVDMFARAFPDLEIVARANPPDARLLQPDIGLQAPFSDLPRRLGVDLAAAPPPKAPYLRALPELAAACRSRYRARGGGLIVGIAWASGNVKRPERNAPLALWDPILGLPGLTFVSLQYGGEATTIADVRRRLGVDIHVDPAVDQMASLEQFAAQVDAMDIVVSISNTTVHMAGALGKPVWTMLPFVADWRYQKDRGDTPWYPAMRLFRQTKARQWQDVIARVAAELAAFRDKAPPT